MTDNREQELKIYEVTHRETGEKSYQAATNAQDACKQAGWLIGDCFVVAQKPRHRRKDKHETQPLVKVSCEVCPYQYAECRKPSNVGCPTRPSAPDFNEWTKQALKAHLCPYVGQALTRKDYFSHEKWVSVEEAVKELSAKL